MNKENEILRQIIIDTIWMARRYADGRFTYAPSMVNDALDMCKEMGLDIRNDDTLHSGDEYATVGDQLNK